MGKIVVITGTDTGIGKTWVGCRLAEALRRLKVNVRAVKLVETGTLVEPSPEEDGVLLARAAAQQYPLAALRRYRSAVAAAEAADREKTPLDLPVMLEETRLLSADAELTLVEGAGGLLAPITWETTMIDVARELQAQALVVAADKLGTINHTLLTVGALEAGGVSCAAVVFTQIGNAAEDASVGGSNAAALARVRPGLPLYSSDDPKAFDRLARALLD